MSKNILIVDDAAFMRKLLTDILSKAGYQVIGEAGDGQEAFLKYKELKPNLVTMDITMPDVSGIEGLKKIIEFDPNAKVLMCSAMGQEAMVIDSVKSGAKGFIVKPFIADKVVYEVSKLIG
jgi:two-component system chemotaxis response regulator CheY